MSSIGRSVYAFFEAVREPPIVDNGEDGWRRSREILEGIHQDKVQHDVVEGEGLHASVLHLCGHLVALIRVADKDHHGVVGFQHVPRILSSGSIITKMSGGNEAGRSYLVRQEDEVGYEGTSGGDEPLAGSFQMEHSLAGEADAVQFAQVFDIRLAAHHFRTQHSTEIEYQECYVIIVLKKKSCAAFFIASLTKEFRFHPAASWILDRGAEGCRRSPDRRSLPNPPPGWNVLRHNFSFVKVWK